jgi:deazaflavin-dependent oxidoreductase (nitroreductase family)
VTETKQPEGLPDWIADHVQLYLEDPDRGHNWDSTPVGGPGVLPTLLLYTTGRKSGKTRALPLIYGKTGEAWVVIASKGGAPAHPAWYLNLEAHPECEVQVAHLRQSVLARTASGAERESLWRQLAEIYPPYDDYQTAAGDREIPVVVLDPLT